MGDRRRGNITRSRRVSGDRPIPSAGGGLPGRHQINGRGGSDAPSPDRNRRSEQQFVAPTTAESASEETGQTLAVAAKRRTGHSRAG